MRAVISGYGAVSALGRGADRIWSAMAAGSDGIAPIQRFNASAIGVELAALVPDRNTPNDDSGPTSCVDFTLAAAREAWQRAELDRFARHRIAFVFGSSLGDPRVRIHEITEHVGNELGVLGPRLTVSTACASSANAIGLALDLLNLGIADAVIAGGADVVTPLVLAGFHALGVLATGKCAPFSEPAGTSLGEGAGFLVLERGDASPRAEFSVLGYGLSIDAFHDTGPDPSGAGVVRGLRAALDHAGVTSASVDYFNAHGTGTRANDPAEWRAIQHVFGERANQLPVSSSKSFLGHAQGAAGVLETIATLVALERGAIPPTQRFTVARPNAPRDAVGQPKPRAARCDIAVCASSGFGGANCSVVIGRDQTTRMSPAATRRPVSIEGLGIVGPHGVDVSAELTPRSRGRVRELRFEDSVPTADPRGLDPSTRYVTVAVARALTDARLRLRGGVGDRTGLVLGVTSISPESDTTLYRTIDQYGLRGLSTTMFARQVLNAPAGTCARLLGLRGAHSTVSAASATGLLAFVYAAELVASRRDCDRVAAVAVDELARSAISDTASEGAACAILTATPGPVAVAGWSIAGPGRLADAVAAALDAAALAQVDIVIGPALDGVRGERVFDPAQLFGASDAFTPAAAIVVGAAAIRAGQARHVLIAGSGGASADCAVVLTAGARHAN